MEMYTRICLEHDLTSFQAIYVTMINKAPRSDKEHVIVTKVRLRRELPISSKFNTVVGV